MEILESVLGDTGFLAFLILLFNCDAGIAFALGFACFNLFALFNTLEKDADTLESDLIFISHFIPTKRTPNNAPIASSFLLSQK